MDAQRALHVIVVTALVAIVAGCASATGSLAPGPLSLSPLAAPSQATPPVATPLQTTEPTPRPTPKPTPAPVPPEPTGVTFNVRQEALGGEGVRLTATVTWRTPRSSGTTIRVFNVTECLSQPTPYMPENAEGPCLVEHTPLPPSVLKLAAAAPAPASTVSWTWIDDSEIGWRGPAFEIVVLAAYDESGAHSIFAIASPGQWTSKVTW